MASHLALPFAGYVDIFLLLSRRGTDNIGENMHRRSKQALKPLNVDYHPYILPGSVHQLMSQNQFTVIIW